jgi:hypothetical protein
MHHMTHQWRNAALPFLNFSAISCRNILETVPSFDSNKSHYFEDLDGDDIMHSVCLDSNERTERYYSRYRSGWNDFVPFMSNPTININESTLVRIDLTGNRQLDLLYFDAHTQQLTWHECFGKHGLDRNEE